MKTAKPPKKLQEVFFHIISWTERDGKTERSLTVSKELSQAISKFTIFLQIELWRDHWPSCLLRHTDKRTVQKLASMRCKRLCEIGLCPFKGGATECGKHFTRLTGYAVDTIIESPLCWLFLTSQVYFCGEEEDWQEDWC